MHVAEIKLWNFRQFGDDSSMGLDLNKPNLTLELNSGLNVLIGANDSGKTAIVDAIKLVLKTHSQDWTRVEHSDFFRDSKEFRIELMIRGMSSEEAAGFTEWLGWKTDDEGVVYPYLRLAYQAGRAADRILPRDVKAGVDDTGKTLSAEARESLKSTYLKPLRDAKGELTAKRHSRLSQILKGHSAFKDKDDSHQLVASYKVLNSEIQEYFKGKNVDGSSHLDQEGKKLKDKIDDFVKAFLGDNELSSINASAGDLTSILERLEIVVLNRINPGLGTLNRLFMGTELVHISRHPWSGLRIGLIEELEAHLSPQAQMQVVEKLQSEKGIQLLLTTHSPNLASKVKLENIIMLSQGSAFALTKSKTALNDDDYIFLEKFLDVTKSNLFFAKGVILVEGAAEELIIPSLAKRLGYDLTKYGVSVVNVGSTAFLRYSRIFKRKDTEELMGIPVSVVTDVDVRAYEHDGYEDAAPKKTLKSGGSKQVKTYIKVNEATRKELSLAKVALIEKEYNGGDVKAFVAPEWTLEYSLGSSALLGGIFKAIVSEVHPQLNEEDFDTELAKKLINKGLNKTEISYKLAQKLDEDTDQLIYEDNDAISYLLSAIKHACRQ